MMTLFQERQEMLICIHNSLFDYDFELDLVLKDFVSLLGTSHSCVCEVVL